MIVLPLADRRRLTEALAAAAHLGPYFTLTGDSATLPLPLRTLCEPRQLHPLLDAIGRRTGTGEARVAASTLQYGLAARCWSLILGAWQCGDVVIDLEDLGYVVTAPGSVELAATDPSAWDCTFATADAVAALIADTVIAQLSLLHAALHTGVRIADGLLWGNAASALVSAASTLDASHPDDDLAAVTTTILAHPLLADRMIKTSPGGVRRRSCCLWYRTDERSNCADCPLTGRPVVRQ